MKIKWPRVFFASLVLLSSVFGTQVFAKDGRALIQQQYDLSRGYLDEKTMGKMVIVSKSGSETVREFSYLIKEQQGNVGSKGLIKIESPADLKGVGLLSHENPNGEDDQWLYLPALKKTKRIAGAGKKGRFIGSDFSYEDLSPKDIEDFTYQFLREEPCDDGLCDVVQATSKDPKSSYSKTISWVRQDNHQTIKMQLFDEKGAHVKTMLFQKLTQFKDKFWRPYLVTMKNIEKNRETRLEFSAIELQTGLGDAAFSKSALER